MEENSTELEKAINLLDHLQFHSIDKDNMEFRVTFTCYQRDALKLVLEAAWQYNDLTTS